MSKQAKVRFALIENFSKTDSKLEMTNTNTYKNVMPIKTTQNEHARANKFAVTFRINGSKNSGYAVAILDKVRYNYTKTCVKRVILQFFL